MMETLIGLFGILAVVLILGSGIKYLIKVIRGPRVIFNQKPDQQKMGKAQRPDGSYEFKKGLARPLLFPVSWILIFTLLMFSQDEIGTAIFGTVLLTWFMFFQIYYLFKSRNDAVYIRGHELIFQFEKSSRTIDVSSAKEMTIEFQVSSSVNGKLILPVLLLGPESPDQVFLTNAALIKFPWEVVEAIRQLNPKMQITRSWNDLIKKKKESEIIHP